MLKIDAIVAAKHKIILTWPEHTKQNSSLILLPLSLVLKQIQVSSAVTSQNVN